MIALERLNSTSAPDFAAALASIFEHSPWVPELVAASRPFPSVIALHQAMSAVVLQAEEAVQLALIRAHPELAGRAALRGDVTSASTSEQKGAGLAALTQSQLTLLSSLNAE